MNNKEREAFSKQLDELRNLAIAITKDRNIKLKWDEKSPTCHFNYENNEITLTASAYPQWVRDSPRLLMRFLDSSTLHESLHKVLSKPLVPYVEKWVEQLQLIKGAVPKLAGEIVNIVEDKRCNYYGKSRYRFDLGKRQQLKEMVFKDALETEFRDHLKNGKLTTNEGKVVEPNLNGLILSAFANKALYDVDVTPICQLIAKEKNGKEILTDIDECLKITEELKYGRLRIDVVNGYKKIYNLLRKHIETEEGYGDLILTADEGKLKGKLSQAMKDALAKMIKDEIDAEKAELEKDLQKGATAGEGSGDSIASPEPDFEKYEELVSDVKPEIDRLLAKLKTMLKPQIRRDIYQKRGRFMSNLVSNAYTNSMRRQVSNVYIQNTLKMEKEKVNIAFLTDFSGSVSRETALRILTIFTETFGTWLDDYSYFTACFGDNNQKIKSFVEKHYTTRARVANISVSPSGTRLHDLLLETLKCFNSIKEPDRRKMLVVASDFCVSDQSDCEKLLEDYKKTGIDILLIGFDSCSSLNNFAVHVKGIERTSVKDYRDIPEAFISVYFNAVKF